ncbi:hypothetical protein FISHEDRAFT_66561 [Fistulina hepatica ATCC 64428]|uniref:4'-phosphopantetheinyl transferase domain-containing protein n=1 Tax=Fistulina hepatica ATCC 64428 TaxID=1128425 RepID=A0A0D7A5J3_9AGAR|nr:hypothetical protein FISHEDRAFT_66561 [Fistulina hepatica ATCC 64428]
MISLNRDYTKQEYDLAYGVIREALSHVKLKYEPLDPVSFRKVMMNLLPLLMMRHRRIPRSRWEDRIGPNGKHWIEQSREHIAPEKWPYSMIGYHLEYGHSICGMAMTQGTVKRVVNIGLGIRRVVTEPRGTPIATYIESQHHKTEEGDPGRHRRLHILLALKESYIKAIGQPLGFDLSRLEFDVPGRTLRADGRGVAGWEFRIFSTKLGVARGLDRFVEEEYQCACAFFRGSSRHESRFVWYQTQEELDAWVQFINIDQMVKVIPKLTA